MTSWDRRAAPWWLLGRPGNNRIKLDDAPSHGRHARRRPGTRELKHRFDRSRGYPAFAGHNTNLPSYGNWTEHSYEEPSLPLLRLDLAISPAE